MGKEIDENKDMQSEMISIWGQKESVEQALLVGIHGVPEIKHNEKINYLGEFKENVLLVLSKEQVMESIVYSEVSKALEDEKGKKMIIDGSIGIPFIEKYKKLAGKLNKPYTVRNNPEFTGRAGLLVSSDEAVDVQIITVKERSERLKEKGISPLLIQAAGKKICKECWEQLSKADPTEVENYYELTFLDRLIGETYPGHEIIE